MFKKRGGECLSEERIVDPTVRIGQGRALVFLLSLSLLLLCTSFKMVVHGPCMSHEGCRYEIEEPLGLQSKRRGHDRAQPCLALHAVSS